MPSCAPSLSVSFSSLFLLFIFLIESGYVCSKFVIETETIYTPHLVPYLFCRQDQKMESF
jgi:hypothetical protein